MKINVKITDAQVIAEMQSCGLTWVNADTVWTTDMGDDKSSVRPLALQFGAMSAAIRRDHIQVVSQQVYKLSYDDYDEIDPMYCASLKEVADGLDAMLDGLDVGTSVTVEIVEVEPGFMDDLKPWEA